MWNCFRGEEEEEEGIGGEAKEGRLEGAADASTGMGM